MSKHVLNTRRRRRAQRGEWAHACVAREWAWRLAENASPFVTSETSPGQLGLGSELEQIYRTRAPALAARISRRGRTDDGLDILHEAVARALDRPDPVRDPIVSVEAFLVRISGNILADRARQQRTKDRWLEGTSGSQVHHDPVTAMESRDALRRLEAALIKLRPMTRNVFVLRRVQGLSYAEIAERTGLSPKAVEKRMAKAIAKLSRLMDRC